MLRLTRPISAALADRRPIVALESSVLAQGLPAPANREAAERMCNAVRGGGAEPGITAVVAGVPTVGLEPGELERFLSRSRVRKVSARDLSWAVAHGEDGATTVAASLVLARWAGISVFATGGIGGVHRLVPGAGSQVRDESADLLELARTSAVVVCAGAKSILDLPGTMERLETLGVPVVGYRTDELPGFLTRGTGIPLPAHADSPAEIARVFQAQLALGVPAALLVVQPPPPELALPEEEVEQAVARGLEAAERDGVQGSAVTPFLLAEVERATGGRSLGVNLGLLERNAALAAEIAVALAMESGGAGVDGP